MLRNWLGRECDVQIAGRGGLGNGPSAPVDVMAEPSELAPSDRLSKPAPFIDVPARAEHLTGIRHALRTWLTELGACDELVADVLLAVDEACTNCVEHAYAGGDVGTMTVSAALDARDVHVVVRDSGRWKTDADDDVRRGRGMPVMRALTSHFDVRHESEGTQVTLVFPFRDACEGPAST